MLHEQKLQSLHCRDLRVEDTKLKWSTKLSCLPLPVRLFKYSVSKPPKYSWILSLLVLFVEKFLESFSKGESRFVVGYFISFILDANCCYFWVASEDILYKAVQDGRWIALTELFSTDIYQVCGKKSRLAAVLSRNRFETYVFKLHIFNLNNETRRMALFGSSSTAADIPRIFAVCLIIFFRDP